MNYPRLQAILTLTEKFYWLLASFFLIYIFYLLYAYYAGEQHAINKSIYKRYYLKEILLPFSILTVSCLLYTFKYRLYASLLLGIPVFLAIAKNILVFLAWAFLAIIFSLFGQK